MIGLTVALAAGCAKGDTGFKPQDNDAGRDAKLADKSVPDPDRGVPTPDRGEPDQTLWPTDKGVPTPDKGMPTPDKGVPTPDQGTPTPDLGTPNGGPLIITEFMANPKLSLTDGDGEWLELMNVSGAAIDLKNWTLADAGSDSVTISASIVVQPGQRVLLGANPNTSQNGGVAGIHAWGTGFVLANSADEIILRDPQGTQVDRVDYVSAWIKDGQSISLRSTSLDNTLLASWCVEDVPWSTGSDFGTPGQPPHCQ